MASRIWWAWRAAAVLRDREQELVDVILDRHTAGGPAVIEQPTQQQGKLGGGVYRPVHSEPIADGAQPGAQHAVREGPVVGAQVFGNGVDPFPGRAVAPVEDIKVVVTA
jgi:hypothetical protein